MAICHQFDSQTSILDLSDCCEGPEIVCLIDAVRCTGCEVIPTWDYFQVILDNPGIILALETDGTYTSVTDLIHATEAEVDLVPGIGPASIAALAAALAEFNLGFVP